MRPIQTNDIVRISGRAFFVFLLLAMGSASAQTDIPANAAWMPGEIVFEVSTAAMSSYKPVLATSGRTGIAAIDAAMQRLGATDIRHVFDLTLNAEPKRSLGMDRIFKVRYAGGDAPPAAAARLANLAEVEWAEPNGIVRGDFVPNDSLYGLQWGIRNRGQAVSVGGDSVGTADCDTDANQAWDVQTGSFTLILAVLDTGIDRGHPEFATRVMTGYDFVNDDNDPNDDHGHGTSCTGIAAAAGNNGRGIAGVAWGVRILPIKVLNASNQGTSAILSAGITLAADNGADVISMSLGGTAAMVIQTAVNFAWGRDCLMVAAAGNGNANAIAFPAAYDHVIAVGALSPCNERKSPTSCDGENSWGSNFGPELDVMAPGTRVHTTDIRGAGGFNNPGDYFNAFNGTSAATPFVAGIAALARSQVNSTNDQISTILTQSCDDLGSPSWDQETGWGRLNAYAVMRTVTGGYFVGANPFTEVGTYRNPFRTLIAAVNITQAGNWVVVKPGTYDEATPLSINKNLHVEAIDGGVTIR